MKHSPYGRSARRATWAWRWCGIRRSSSSLPPPPRSHPPAGRSNTKESKSIQERPYKDQSPDRTWGEQQQRKGRRADEPRPDVPSDRRNPWRRHRITAYLRRSVAGYVRGNILVFFFLLALLLAACSEE
jgi:hypothetical protein